MKFRKDKRKEERKNKKQKRHLALKVFHQPTQPPVAQPERESTGAINKKSKRTRHVGASRNTSNVHQPENKFMQLIDEQRHSSSYDAGKQPSFSVFPGLSSRRN